MHPLNRTVHQVPSGGPPPMPLPPPPNSSDCPPAPPSTSPPSSLEGPAASTHMMYVDDPSQGGSMLNVRRAPPTIFSTHFTGPSQTDPCLFHFCHSLCLPLCLLPQPGLSLHLLLLLPYSVTSPLCLPLKFPHRPLPLSLSLFNFLFSPFCCHIPDLPTSSPPGQSPHLPALGWRTPAYQLGKAMVKPPPHPQTPLHMSYLLPPFTSLELTTSSPLSTAGRPTKLGAPGAGLDPNNGPNGSNLGPLDLDSIGSESESVSDLDPVRSGRVWSVIHLEPKPAYSSHLTQLSSLQVPNTIPNEASPPRAPYGTHPKPLGYQSTLTQGPSLINDPEYPAISYYSDKSSREPKEKSYYSADKRGN
ncbi:hypothetical protein AMTRI_Chr02g219640 [Amborella trichopoda]